jgi:penicillin amidase
LLVRSLGLLRGWDRRFTTENDRAVLFETAMRELATLTWDELAEGDSSRATLIATPAEHVLYGLTLEPESVWWDRSGTSVRETRDMILATALATALGIVESERGPASAGNWRWGRIRTANIWHPLRIRALSALDLSVQGGRETLSPSSGTGTHGASWRLVAELGPSISARAIYPGGQSANPLSVYYRDRIERWRRGALDSLRIPATPDALTQPHRGPVLKLTAGGGR